MCDRSERAKERTLHHRGRGTEHDHIAELARGERELQGVRHALGIGVPEAGEAEQGFDEVTKAFAGRDLYACARVAVAAGVPPVMPDTRLDNPRLAFTQDAGLPLKLQGKFALEHGEALHNRGVAVLANDSGPDQRGQLRGHAAFAVLRWKLEDPGALPGNRVLPNLTDLDRGEIRRAVRIGMRHSKTLPGRWSAEATRGPVTASLSSRGAPHAYCRAEPGLRATGHVEADSFIEALRGSGNDLKRVGTLISGVRSRVFNQCASNAGRHLNWFDEQPLDDRRGAAAARHDGSETATG